MRCMVGHYTVDGAVLESTPQRFLVLSIANRRIHQDSNTQRFYIILVECKVLSTNFSRNEVALVLAQPVCLGRTCEVHYVEPMIVILGKSRRSLSR